MIGVGSVLGTIGSVFSAGAGALAGAGLNALSSWVMDGARAALLEAATIIAQATAPHLESTWFSVTYWRVGGIAFLLTLPFLCAAAVQAVFRSDLTLLLRAAFGYLPLSVLGVFLAAPLLMLLLRATDEMCAIVSAVGVDGGARFLAQAAVLATGVSAVQGSAFFVFSVGLAIAGAAILLSLEMLAREAAVYVATLMLPLAFAGLVWPARRIWAVRLLELLVALILSKFVIVAVLSLAGAAFGSAGASGVSRLLTAMSLVMLSVFAPWALVRLIPFTEMGAAAVDGMTRRTREGGREHRGRVAGHAGIASDWVGGVTAAMSRHAGDAGQTVLSRGRSSWDGDGAAAGGGQRATPGEEAPGASGSAVERPAGGEAGGPSGGAVTGTPNGTEASRARSGLGGNGTGANGTGADGVGPSRGAPSGAEPAPARRERLPGHGPIWQAENGEWPPMTLGPNGWSGPTEYAPPSEPERGALSEPEPGALSEPEPGALSEPEGGPSSHPELPPPGDSEERL